jgi:hypothetical protein
VIARSYLPRRLAFALLVVFGVTVTTFLLMHAVPGDPAAAVLGEHATPAAVAALRRQWGLSQTLPQQFGHFVVDLLTLRLGDSYIYHTPVATLIASRIGLTAALVALATLFAVVITVPLNDVKDQVLTRTAAIPGLSARGPQIAGAVQSGQIGTVIARLPAPARQVAGTITRAALTAGLNRILLVAAIIAFVAGVVSLAAIRSRDFARAASGGQEGPGN